MGKVLPEYLSNWTTEKVRRGEAAFGCCCSARGRAVVFRPVAAVWLFLVEDSALCDPSAGPRAGRVPAVVAQGQSRAGGGSGSLGSTELP